MRKFSKTFLNRAQSIVAFMDAKPGKTVQEIAYRLSLATSTVHDVILNDPSANARAQQHKVVALDYHLKPRWWSVGMPVVKAKDAAFDVMGEFSGEFDHLSDPTVRAHMVEIANLSAGKMLRPSKSIRQRKRDARAVVSQVKLASVKFQDSVMIARDLAPRLEAIESKLALLSAPQANEARYGTPELRKNRA